MVFRILIHESEYMINQGAALIVEPTLPSRFAYSLARHPKNAEGCAV